MTGALDHDQVLGWVDRYERAWREDDVVAVADLFTEDARYRPSPYEPSAVGHEAIRSFWLDDQGRAFSMTAAAVAVEDPNAVVRVQVQYEDPSQEYRDLWVMRFASDGRVEDFEEWAYWPGRGYTAAGDAPDTRTGA